LEAARQRTLYEFETSALQLRNTGGEAAYKRFTDR
jgi:hypothetical protein